MYQFSIPMDAGGLSQGSKGETICRLTTTGDKDAGATVLSKRGDFLESRTTHIGPEVDIWEQHVMVEVLARYDRRQVHNACGKREILP